MDSTCVLLRSYYVFFTFAINEILSAGFLFDHFAKNSGRKKTQVFAIFGETQPIFCKTQVKVKKSSFINKDFQKTHVKNLKSQLSGFSQVALGRKSGQKKKSLLYVINHKIKQHTRTKYYCIS